ncbi:branched-chain amino acid ABC transporter substrate-binding protein [Hyphomicrobium methylovorum]|uniref:ABC transporter substrate-binding protein n=1 Tax=Hyphomicrobium methylovorum TaxID=84 RepID=UPI0015E7703B|nr:ABC transporter substrate-binding protein [Hyphomicrobium methylovorum]MBA2127702.1 branched-chain amino acid ABC transporter substrate-binding protein [Hyphomicrobium methylovorum]
MAVAGALALACWPGALYAEDAAKPAAAGEQAIDTNVQPAKREPLNVSILYLKQNRTDELPLSLLDLPSPDDGIAGAKLGIADNNTTGRFLNQTFKLDTLEGTVDELIAGAKEKQASGDSFIIADLDPDGILKLSDALSGKPAIIFNVGNPDDRLREEDCRANVMHVAPTRTMLADALGQYLAWKQWRNWFLVSGPRPEDKLLADAYRRAAKKFGAKIVEDREFKQETGSRRADGGFEQVQQQIPSFMQRAKDHDVVVVADDGKLFADYFPFRTWVPRPVAGSAGLTPTSWHPALELWGGTQFQHRFRRLNNRQMRTIDYDAWVATRAIGEAVTRRHTTDFKVLHDFIHSPEFEVAAFKGVALSFRTWNGQLREPLIVGTPKLLVSVSPQPGFLHQFSTLDTLGLDKPETKCKAYAQ